MSSILFSLFALGIYLLGPSQLLNKYDNPGRIQASLGIACGGNHIETFFTFVNFPEMH